MTIKMVFFLLPFKLSWLNVAASLIVILIITVLLRGLNDIAAISSYIHLRFLDVSNNHLTDLSPLASLTQLLWLKARISHLFILEKYISGEASISHCN